MKNFELDNEMDEKIFAQKTQDALDNFKEQMRSTAGQTISNFYANVIPFATFDAEINYKNKLQDKLMDEIKDGILKLDGPHTWAQRYRTELVEKHKEELSNMVILDLQQQVKWLKDRLKEVNRSRN